ncbi:MAG TPA: S9 family peptidase, partial [Anaerolineales bacterium]|nr:S9 family peptidase [Anaerolineales bacterium]
FVWDREGQSDVYTMPAAGGWPSRISFERRLTAYWDDSNPQWSPDSGWIAFTQKSHVHIAPASGGLSKKLTGFTESAFSPVWMPDGDRLLVSVEKDDHISILVTDRDGGWPRTLVDDPSGDAWDVQVSPDGRLVAYVHRPFDDLNRLDIRVVEVETGQIRTLVGEPKIRAWSPRWSPEGSVLAFITERPDFNEAWLVRPDGETPRQLTHLGQDVTDLAWAPDGSRLAATINHGGSFDLALIDAQTGEAATLGPAGGFHSRPHWEPDGTWLTVEFENPFQPPDLYRVDPSTGSRTQLTFSNPAALAANRLAAPEAVAYKSFDGREIPAFLYRPEKPNGAAVVHPHGGPSSLYALEWDILTQYFVAKGYTWIAPNYRGSTGYGYEFEHLNYGDWGGGDAKDVLHAARYVAGIGGVDPTRIAVYGGSYGGYMTACTLSRDPDDLFACGISKYGDANLYSTWAQSNRDLRLYTEIFLGHPSENRDVFRAGSPVHEVENVRVPVLVLHGLLDDVVPPEASEEWVQALKAAGKTFEYKTYADEPHGFLMRKTQQDAWGRIEQFLDWYLMVR